MLRHRPPLSPLLLWTVLWSTVARTSLAVEPLRLYGINYNNRQGPDWDWDKCKDEGQVLQDLTVLSGLTNRVRILSLSDCGQGMKVLRAAERLNLQVLLGMWVSEDAAVVQLELETLADMLARGMISSERVLGVTVGSEAVYRKEVTADTIMDYLQQAKQVMVDAGFPDIPVSPCDIDDIYLQFPQLFEGDQVVVNSFPYWESKQIDQAVSYLEGEMEPVFARANGKPFVLGETGWPSSGVSSVSSVSSPENQAQYLVDFYCRMDQELGWAYYYFTGIDNDWRLAQDNQTDSVEAHFGLLNPDLTLKDYYVDFAFSCPGSSVEYSIQLGTASTTTTPAPVPSDPSPTPASPNGPSEPTTSPDTPGEPTPAPDDPVEGVRQCAAYSRCAAMELQGDCCPTPEGIFLGCCDDGPTNQNNEETDGPNDNTNGVDEPNGNTDGVDEPNGNTDAVDEPTMAVEDPSPTFAPSARTDSEPTIESGDLTVSPTMALSDIPSGAPIFGPVDDDLNTDNPGLTTSPTPDDLIWDPDTGSNAITDNSGAASARQMVLTVLSGSLVWLLVTVL